MSLTKVVNLKFERYDVYIGRSSHGLDGIFGNPYKVGERCIRCKCFHLNAESVIPCYRGYFEDRISFEPRFKDRIHSLLGKTLGCFCKPGPCHGDVIVEYLELRHRPALHKG